MKLRLSHEYKARDNAPLIKWVSAEIFTRKNASSCNGCHATCCAFGTDLDGMRLCRILKYLSELETLTGIDSAKWFEKTVRKCDNYPSGIYLRIKAYDWRCVFLSKDNLCVLHKFALDRGIEYQEFKPLSCWLFPISFRDKYLVPSVLHVLYHTEPHPHKIICKGEKSLYRNARKDLTYLFGDELVKELDTLERSSCPDEVGQVLKGISD